MKKRSQINAQIAHRNRIVIVNSRFLQCPQQAKFREPAYSEALNENKIGREGSRPGEAAIRQAGRQAAMVDSV